MSGSGGYDYEYADRERSRRQARRGELAELDARCMAVRRVLRRLGAAAEVPDELETPGADADSDRLQAAVDRARVIVERAERRAAERQTDRLLSRIAERGDDHRTRRPSGRRTASGAAGRAPGGAAERTGVVFTGADPDRARRSALDRAAQVLAREGGRCDPEHADRIDASLAEIGAARTAEAARLGLARLEAEVTSSVRARAEREEAAVVHARLAALTDELPAEQGRVLRAELDAAHRSADRAALDAVGGRVEEATAAYEAERIPERVAAATAAALDAIGCDVGAEFTAVLARDGEAVAALGADWPGADRPGAQGADRYWLLVRHDRAARRISTAVVRNPDAPADAAADAAAQRSFCARRDDVRAHLDSADVTVVGEAWIEPGARPVPAAPAVPAGRSERTVAGKRTGRTSRARTTEELRARERELPS
ncbi:hypothetical protein [Actinomadura algeriensis]|uniref:DUF222 domain-containing protein n=1 Tax=Actinomadura algeriensis TaxID=1679523 RepID=A0ABR9K2G9_9ACTN|nr:hypothetical protein [Actinomadura algeriensis]MBE1537051.1 hypothetical protein [Actinomadura algeriensis]